MLSGLHLLLTYECNFQCRHCFVWGAPTQGGTMTLDTVRHILDEADALGSVEWIYFEGGEAFLYYAVLCAGVALAAERGYRVGIVTNAYWATAEADAVAWLKPFANRVLDLSLSSDAYHGAPEQAQRIASARAAAERLGLPVSVITVAQPDNGDAQGAFGQLPAGESAVLYRGRAAETLAPAATKSPPRRFTACPWEDLREPGRVHVDAFGNLHICQGISIGNLLREPLVDICRNYDPDAHPIVGPLLEGGPAELARRHGVATADGYADACHLCYATRCALREEYPLTLTPDQMYGPVG